MEQTSQGNSKTPRVVEVVLTEKTQNCLSRVWVSFFPSGHLSPLHLLEHAKIEDLFEDVAQDGLLEEKPLLISKGDTDSSYLVYYLPYLTPSHSLWDFDNFTKSLKDQKLETVGLYIDPRIVKDMDLRGRCLEKFMISMVKRLPDFQKLYLYIGKNDYTEILNQALQLSRKNTSFGKTKISIFH